MPSSEEDRIKALFADLGRPTLRGIRKCYKCGTVNGTRGKSCKNKSCDVVFRDNGSKTKAFVEACKVLVKNTAGPVYSVRLRRDQVTDHRCFVQVNNDNTHDEEGNSSVGTNYKCYAESCTTKSNFQCSHITAVQKCFAESQQLKILPAAVLNLDIPYEIRQEVSNISTMDEQNLVQRVSSSTFVVNCETSEKHPLGVLHLIVVKPNQGETLDTRYLCACRAKKSQSSNEAPSVSGDAANKYCNHFYYALCAFASDETLASEFNYILAQETLKFTSLLNPLDLVDFGNHGSGNSIDEFGASNHSHVSVEVLEGNLSFSLLENISTETVSNVQELESVLEGHVIAANADDNFRLDDEADMQDFDPSDDAMSQILPMDRSDLTTDDPQPLKRRKQGVPGWTSASCNRKVLPGSYLSTENQQKSTAEVQKPVDQLHRNEGRRKTHCAKRNSDVTDRNAPTIEFNQWLAGVIERINLSLNYGNSPNPDPLVYMISSDFFEHLKERIVSGIKKKRLPNITSIIKRQDICPGKTYTRHVWKISHLLLLKRIFDSNLVPFKWNQQFMKTNQGVYEEWVKPNTSLMTGNNLQIAPVLQSACIKIGRPIHSPPVGEPAAFIIEWIPDLYPISKMGELTLKYEIVHSP